jgi:hypothetical protein
MTRNVILDLDSTLINSYEESDAKKRYESMELFSKNHSLRSRVYYFYLEQSRAAKFVWGVFRPHYKDFIDYCFQNFDHVLVWSAGGEEYVDKICSAIFGRRKSKLSLIWSRNNCDEDPQLGVVKKMERLVLENPYLSMSNTVIVDDNPDTFMFNPCNALQITPYKIPFTSKKLVSKLYGDSDHHLRNLQHFLETDEDFWEVDDVRDANPGRIF